MDAVVHFDQVSIRIGDKLILDGVSCKVAAGAVVAILGESGSGKSTMLHAINGSLPSSAGCLTVLGERLPVHRPETLRRRMGFAIQNAALMPHLRVFENLTIMARLGGWPKERMQRRFKHLMELLELDPALGTRYPHELSGGQQHRVSLGRAFMLDPEMLLLDEPFSAVDAITRGSIFESFEALMAVEHRSAIMVTHNLREARRLADELIVVRAGQIMQTGSFNVIAAHPANDYVERLFAADDGC